MANETFSNVWDALYENPEEAANMTLRSELMSRVQAVVATWDVSQAVAAKRLGISQPRLNDLLRDRLARFSLDALVILAVRAGFNVELHLARPEPVAA